MALSIDKGESNDSIDWEIADLSTVENIDMLPQGLLEMLKTPKQLQTLNEQAAFYMKDMKDALKVSTEHNIIVSKVQKGIIQKEAELREAILEVVKEARAFGDDDDSAKLGGGNVTEAAPQLPKTDGIPMEVDDQPTAAPVNKFPPDEPTEKVGDSQPDEETLLLAEQKAAQERLTARFRELNEAINAHLYRFRKRRENILATRAKVSEAYKDLTKKIGEGLVLRILEENMNFMDKQLAIIMETVSSVTLDGKVKRMTARLSYRHNYFESRLELITERKRLAVKQQKFNKRQ